MLAREPSALSQVPPNAVHGRGVIAGVTTSVPGRATSLPSLTGGDTGLYQTTLAAFEAVLSLGLAIAYILAGPVLRAVGPQPVYRIGGLTALVAALVARSGGPGLGQDQPVARGICRYMEEAANRGFAGIVLEWLNLTLAVHNFRPVETPVVGLGKRFFELGPGRAGVARIATNRSRERSARLRRFLPFARNSAGQLVGPIDSARL